MAGLGIDASGGPLARTRDVPFDPYEDLKRAISSPVLLAPDCFGPGSVVTDAECAELAAGLSRELDAAGAEDLAQYVAPAVGRRKLGAYFESLVGYWSRAMLGASRSHSNTQIRVEKDTIGELDLVFSDPVTRVDRHWELAAKFYLRLDELGLDARDPKAFVGPSFGDRLDRKLKTLERQLGLSKHEESRRRLAELGFSSQVRAEAFVKGMLHYPSHLDWRAQPVPDCISPSHERGWWTDSERLEIPRTKQDSRWAVLGRIRWLFPATLAQATFSFDEMMKEIAVTRLPFIIAEVDSESGLELHRGLVVSAEDKRWVVGEIQREYPPV